MKLRNRILILLCASPVLFCGCDDAEQKKLNKQWVQTAEQNAKDYILQKYGIDAEVTDTKQERRPMWIGSEPLSTVLVNMKYQDRAFKVYIDGSQPNHEGLDSYQKEDLEAFIQEQCEALLPGVHSAVLESTELNSNLSKEESDNLYSGYFDGTNIQDFLNSLQSTITVQYVSTDLTPLETRQEDLKPFFQNEKNKIQFISYRSEEDLQNGFLSAESENAVFADSTYLFTKAESQYHTYQIGSFDSFYYYVVDGNPEDVTVSETVPDDISSWEIGKEKKAKFASKAYAIGSAKDCSVVVWIPKSEISDYERHAWLAVCRGTEYTAESRSPFIYSDEKYLYDIVTFPVHPDEKFYFTFIKY